MSAGFWEKTILIDTVEKLHNMMYLNKEEWQAKYRK
jgi:hypothetical protein